MVHIWFLKRDTKAQYFNITHKKDTDALANIMRLDVILYEMNIVD